MLDQSQKQLSGFRVAELLALQYSSNVALHYRLTATA